MSAEALPAVTGHERDRPRSVFNRFLATPAGAISLALLLAIVAVAVLAPWIAPYDPNLVNLANAKMPPSASHLLGGDSSGRDILSRLIWGARTTLIGAAIALLTSLAIGTPLGVAAGYLGGVFDRIASWVSDALQAVPGMLILLVVASGTRSNFGLIMATVGVLFVPGYFRIARSCALMVRSEAYVDAARVAGLTHPRTVLRHILPSVYAPTIIHVALAAGIAMGIQAGLQFLGIGASNVPSWGAMMSEGFQNVLRSPLLLLWPSSILGVTIATLTVMGATLADVVRVRTATPQRATAARATSGPAAPAGSAPGTSVRVDGLRVRYRTGPDDVEVVHDISFAVAPGEVLGIVGESGSGKSQTVFSILDLLPPGGSYAVEGLWIDGKAVHHLPAGDRARLLGRSIGYIPQEPMANLDPAYTIGHQLTQPLRSVHGKSRTEAAVIARQMLRRVGIADVERVMRAYPHQISGGMAQRVLIAGAIAGRPAVLIADEPTTALDVTVQAEVLELLRELQREFGMALLIVTHNFGVVADLCDRVVVMRHGAIVEAGDVAAVFSAPSHPYTRELLAASLDNTPSRRELDVLYGALHGGTTASAGGHDDRH